MHFLVYFGFVHTVSAVYDGAGGKGEDNKHDDEVQFCGCPLMNIRPFLILVVSLLDMVVVDDTALYGALFAPLLLVVLHDLFFLVRDTVGLAFIRPEARLDLGADQLEELICFFEVAVEGFTIYCDAWREHNTLLFPFIPITVKEVLPFPSRSIITLIRILAHIVLLLVQTACVSIFIVICIYSAELEGLMEACIGDKLYISFLGGIFVDDATVNQSVHEPEPM